MQLVKELDRITTVNIDVARKSWIEKWAPKVLEQAQLEAKTRSATSGAYTEIHSLGKIF